MTTALPRTVERIVANSDLATAEDPEQDRLPSLSADGQRLAFTTAAALVPEDTNGVVDVYLKDFATGAVTRASTDATGAQGNGGSGWASLSPDGKRLLFMSDASNLVPGDTNGRTDIFLKDLTSGAIQRVSTSATGAQGNGACEDGTPIFSPDGRKVLFVSAAGNLVPGDTNNHDDVFIKDLDTGAVQRVSAGPNGVPQGNSNSQYPSFDNTGAQIVIESDASNFFAGDTNNAIDVFIRDLELDFLFPVSTSSTGTLGNGDSEMARFSPDGKYVYFMSAADNLVAGDTNGRRDIFRKNPFTNETIRVSVTADGSQATGGSGIFGNQELSGSWLCDISADGRYLTFASDATNLVPGDTNGVFDIYVKDLATGEVARASTDAAGVQANDFPFLATMSDDGRYIAFESLASNLVPGDNNGLSDYFRVPNPFLTGDTVHGSDASETLTGGLGVDTLSGLGGDDVLSGRGGDDNLHGGPGTDTAAYAGASASFRVVHSGVDWEVDDKSYKEGRDALQAVEKLQFTDKSFELVNPPRPGPPVYNTDKGFLFDAVYYLLDNPELVPTQNLSTALAHYFATGAAQGKAPTSWFDPTWYENRWPDLTPYQFDDATLFMHYNLYGVWEGRSAGPQFDQFDGNRYLADNPDVAAYVDAHLPDFLGSRSNGAIAHYVIYGQHEQRLAYDVVGQQIELGYTIDLGG